MFDTHCIAGQGSGECLDRAESFEAAAAVESGKYDLVITEDLGRIFRRMHADMFCKTCEDFETRLIAIYGYVHTTREDWRLTAFFAAMRHEACNQDTGNPASRDRSFPASGPGCLRGSPFKVCRSRAVTRHCGQHQIRSCAPALRLQSVASKSGCHDTSPRRSATIPIASNARCAGSYRTGPHRNFPIKYPGFAAPVHWLLSAVRWRARFATCWISFQHALM